MEAADVRHKLDYGNRLGVAQGASGRILKQLRVKSEELRTGLA